MAKFDVEGAKAAGYTDAEIADYLAEQEAFDAAAAREAGYTDAEIIGYISAAPAASADAKPVEEPKSSYLDDAAQLLGVTNRAILPYATAAGLGAAAGGIPTGGLGALPGAHQLSGFPTPDVLRMSYWLQMIWIHAVPHPAQVIQLKAFRDRASVHFVGGPMGLRSAPDPAFSITPADAGRPNPALSEVWAIRRNRAVFIDL
jgi:hypothetical protein